MQAPGSGDGAHPKGEGHTLGELIHQCAQALEGALVDSQANSRKPRIPSLEESYLLSWRDLSDRGGPGHGRQEALSVAWVLGIPWGAVHGMEAQTAAINQGRE